jgi:hypothetical protein
MTGTEHVTRIYRVDVYADLIGAPQRPVPYSQGERQYRPLSVHLSYGWSSVATGQTVDVTLTGTRFTNNRVETECLWSREQWPGWLADLVEAHRPRVDEHLPAAGG